MFDPMYFNTYICPQSRQIIQILKGFQDFHDKLLKYQNVILNNLHDDHFLLHMDLNNFKRQHAEKIIKGNILEKVLN